MADNYITRNDDKGTINISEDVVSSIVRGAVTDIDGFAGFSTSAGNEISELIGLKSVPKGIKVQFAEGRIIIDLIIMVSYGSNIIEVARDVQKSVYSEVVSMTGVDDTDVNVHVAGIAF